MNISTKIFRLFILMTLFILAANLAQAQTSTFTY